LENYINEDELILRYESIITVLEIYNDHPDELFLMNINKQISSIFENKKDKDSKSSPKINPGTKTFKCLKRIFISFMKLNFPAPSPENNIDNGTFIKNIVLFLNNFILNCNHLNSDPGSLEFLIEEFDLISKSLKNTQAALLEEILNFIVNKKQYINIELFFEKLPTILNNFDKEVQNKYVFNKIFSIAEAFNIKNPLPPNDQRQIMIIMIDHMKSILDLLEKFDNEELILQFSNIFNKFEDFINSSGLDWRKSVNFIKALRR
jgi:hypothetical protein